jgi:hypothetical protein
MGYLVAIKKTQSPMNPESFGLPHVEFKVSDQNKQIGSNISIHPPLQFETEETAYFKNPETRGMFTAIPDLNQIRQLMLLRS